MCTKARNKKYNKKQEQWLFIFILQYSLLETEVSTLRGQYCIHELSPHTPCACMFLRACCVYVCVFSDKSLCVCVCVFKKHTHFYKSWQCRQICPDTFVLALHQCCNCIWCSKATWSVYVSPAHGFVDRPATLCVCMCVCVNRSVNYLTSVWEKWNDQTYYFNCCIPVPLPLFVCMTSSRQHFSHFLVDMSPDFGLI